MDPGFLAVGIFALLMAIGSFLFRHQLVRWQQESYRKYRRGRMPPLSERQSWQAAWLLIAFSLLGGSAFIILGLVG